MANESRYEGQSVMAQQLPFVQHEETVPSWRFFCALSASVHSFIHSSDKSHNTVVITEVCELTYQEEGPGRYQHDDCCSAGIKLQLRGAEISPQRSCRNCLIAKPEKKRKRFLLSNSFSFYLNLYVSPLSSFLEKTFCKLTLETEG